LPVAEKKGQGEKKRLKTPNLFAQKAVTIAETTRSRTTDKNVFGSGIQDPVGAAFDPIEGNRDPREIVP
jgi:hypothetical protein